MTGDLGKCCKVKVSSGQMSKDNAWIKWAEIMQRYVVRSM